MIRARIDNDWCRCGECGHKLFRIVKSGEADAITIEVKCHSCKGLNTLDTRTTSQNRWQREVKVRI